MYFTAFILAIGSLLLFLLLNHHIFPLASLIILEVEVDLIERSGGVKVDPEVLVVENALNREVRRIIDVVAATSSRLNEEGLLYLSVTLLEKDPAVKAGVSVLIVPFKVRLIIINSNSIEAVLLIIRVLGLLHLIVEVGLSNGWL